MSSKLVPTSCGGAPMPPAAGCSSGGGYMITSAPWPPAPAPSIYSDPYAVMLQHHHHMQAVAAAKACSEAAAAAAPKGGAAAAPAPWQMHGPPHPHMAAAAMHHRHMLAANAVTTGDGRWPSDCYMGYPAPHGGSYHQQVMEAARVPSRGASRPSSPGQEGVAIGGQ